MKNITTKFSTKWRYQSCWTPDTLMKEKMIQILDLDFTTPGVCNHHTSTDNWPDSKYNVTLVSCHIKCKSRICYIFSTIIWFIIERTWVEYVVRIVKLPWKEHMVVLLYTLCTHVRSMINLIIIMKVKKYRLMWSIRTKGTLCRPDLFWDRAR